MRVSVVPQKTRLKTFSRSAAPVVHQRSNRGIGTGFRINNRREAGFVVTDGVRHVTQFVCVAFALFSLRPLISGLRHRNFGSILQGGSYTLAFASAVGCLTFNAAPWLGVSILGFGCSVVAVLVSHFVDLRERRANRAQLAARDAKLAAVLPVKSDLS